MKRRFQITLILFTAFLFRLVLSPYLTYERDVNSWIGWSNWLVERGFGRFYEGWSDYLPGYLYVLWFLGKIRQAFDALDLTVNLFVLYKLPAILADVVTCYLIYFLVKKWRPKMALLASLAYAFNPAIFANSTFWGQIDSVNTLFYLLTLITLIEKRWVLSSLFLAISCLIKPQGIVLIPLITLILFKHKNLKRFTIYYLLFTIFFVSPFIPFVPSTGNRQPATITFILSRYQATFGQYKYTSLNAFNLWAINKMWWKKDSLTFLGLSYKAWGLLLFGAIYTFCLWLLWKNWRIKGKESLTINHQSLVIIFALLFSALFLFPTRVHERHLFSALPLLVITATFIPQVWAVYGWYSLAYVLNLVFAFIWLTVDFREIFPPPAVSILSLFNLVAFAFLVENVLAFTLSFKVGPKVSHEIPRSDRTFRIHAWREEISEVKISPSWQKALLSLVFLIALFTRFFRLSVPSKFMFDEVYHGFTAIEFAKGNPKAWEWWNTPPEGVAYEWTHPPLAKLLMAGGVLIFGENSFGWRVASAAMGVAAVIFLYLLAQALFGNFFVAWVSALLMTFDFLPFVLSRIAMNDIFFLAFQLGSFYFFVKFIAKKDKELTPKNARGYPLLATRHLLLAGLFWGGALASKWSAIYAVFVYTPFLFWKLKKEIGNWRLEIGNLVGFSLSFVILPVAVYLASYLPFFLQGHDLATFIELQKQMWWYHTGLRATHPFTSPWWTWPLDLRPVWFYVDYRQNLIANIYAFGNPVIWWVGLGAILYLGYRLVFNHQPSTINNRLLLVVLGYLAFFLPWARSPRIMFIYHYLPSLPFLYMATAYVLTNTTRYRDSKIFVICYLLFVICLFVFFYPHLAAVHVSKSLSRFYFWLPSWK